MDRNGPCPCGGPGDYDSCCGRFHSGLNAETAESLMRARYSAYVRKDAAFLVRTLHPTSRGDNDLAELKRSFAGTQWIGLRVIDVEAGGPTDQRGQVEFVATMRQGGELRQMRERSHFIREHGSWFYLLRPALSRNDPCFCGSGKKFKRCHGK